MSELFGIYRGLVFETSDPERRGRVRIMAPQPLGQAPSNWAEPVNIGSTEVKVKDRVWIMFEGGDINHPVFFYGAN